MSYGTAAKVVDASVLAAAMFDEPRAQEAREHLRGAELYAPSLLLYEITYVTQKKVRDFPGRSEGSRRALRDALQMDIRFQPVDQLAALELALSTGLTTYDAAYLQLAHTLGVPLVTFDGKLRTASQQP